MGRTLVITNDFPPRPGGIQTFGYEIVRRFDPESVTVLTSNWEGAAEFDAAQDFKIVRANTQTLVPSKSTLSMARQIVVAENITRVLFGAAAPLGLLAAPLRKLGVTNIVGMTQGHMAYHHANRPDDVTKILKRLVGFEPKRAKNLARDTERADLMKYIPDLPF